MACSSGSCESGCYKDKNGEEDQQLEKKKAVNGVVKIGNDLNRTNLCIKCKSNQTIATTIPTTAGDASRFCSDCFRTNLFGKFRFAVTSNAMISPEDNVLVAFSGDTSSRVALQFVHEMQCKAQKNFDASRDRSLPVFGVGVAVVDESAIYPVPSHQLDEAIEDMKLIVSNLAPPRKEFHVASIASIYSSDFGDGMDTLKELVNTVSDLTGKEDLMLHLRMLSLQKIALQNGYTKLVLGTCTSRIACHVIATTVKSFFGSDLWFVRVCSVGSSGSTYLSLNKRLLFVQPISRTVTGSSRVDPSAPPICSSYQFVRPIELLDLSEGSLEVSLSKEGTSDCLIFSAVSDLVSSSYSEHISASCRLRTVKVFDNPRSGINGLVSAFIKVLQEENPSRECTIVRTAGKLTPFHFNRIPEGDDLNAHFASQRRQKKFNLMPNESLPPESFCSICNSPLNKSDLSSLSDVENGQLSAETFGATCCLSCQFQMLPKEPSSVEYFYSLLPQPIIARAKGGNRCNQRWLREQIQDCLLSDSEDGT
ncbi:hypothetical protein HYC85_020207 [Camellia sinensis]|uniref:Cytoplasmic tRNA 2-thiolation protein 2 n=1 Tax=Camellia sinensis TaxID=4442 RepID=A0A7J7GQT7_CAMSI|nr:hypothetical protein HYC85_020207 [Camellia sinensis]